MRVLVTGGAGFIGSNLVDALVARGDEVTVLDDLSSGKESNLSGAFDGGARLVRGDVRDAACVLQAVQDARPQAILHLAAQMDVRRSVADPQFDARTNVEGTINVLEAARRNGVDRVVNTSTGGAMYGEVETIPTPETVAPAPEAPYGTSKHCAEQYCRLYGRLYGLAATTLRLGNVYGPRQDPHGEAGVVAIFCGKAREGERPVVFGDGLQTRDYVHVDDVVRAQIAALGADPGGEINVGTGTEATVLDLVAALAPLATADFTPEHRPARAGEMQRSSLDVTLARERLGWQAEVELVAGLQGTYEALAAAHAA